jgi:hypothetical protein
VNAQFFLDPRALARRGIVLGSQPGERLYAHCHANGSFRELGLAVGGLSVGHRLTLASPEELADGAWPSRGTEPLAPAEVTPDSEAYSPDGSLHRYDAWSDNSGGRKLAWGEWVDRWCERLARDAARYDEENPAYRAARLGKVAELEAALGQAPDLEQANAWGHSLLMSAAVGGNVANIAHLLDRGANPNATNAWSHCALTLAAAAGRAAAIRELVKGGADLDRRMRDRATPLIVAAAHGQTDAVVALLELGADPRARDRYKKTALHRARSPGVVRAMLAAGVPVDLDGRDDTPLHEAIQRQHPADAIEALLAAGADPRLGADSGFDLYKIEWRSAVKKLLADHGAVIPGSRVGASKLK